MLCPCCAWIHRQFIVNCFILFTWWQEEYGKISFKGLHTGFSGRLWWLSLLTRSLPRFCYIITFLTEVDNSDGSSKYYWQWCRDYFSIHYESKACQQTSTQRQLSIPTSLHKANVHIWISHLTLSLMKHKPKKMGYLNTTQCDNQPILFDLRILIWKQFKDNIFSYLTSTISLIFVNIC